MPSSVIGALRVQLGLDSADYLQGLTAAEARAYKAGEKIGKALRSPIDAALSLKGALAGIATAATAAAFTAAAQRAFDYTDAIVDLADRTGATTKTIQEFRYAAQLSGSSVESADTALEKFARTQGLAQSGSDAMVKLFRQLGVTSTDFDTALRQTIDGISKLPTVQQRNAVAMQLFGKSAASLTALLGQGSKGFSELAAEADKLGIVLGDDLLRNAGQANDTLDRMKMILNAQFANAVAQNADSIVSLANGLAQLSGEILRFIQTNPEKALGIIGAIAGGKVGGLPGALIGGSIGAVAGLRRRVNGQDLGGKTNAELAAELRSLAASARGISDKSALGLSTPLSQKQRDFSAIDQRRQQIVAEVERRRKAGVSAPRATADGGTLPTTGNAEGAAAAKKAEADRKAAAREAKRLAEQANRNEQAFQADQFRSQNELQDAQADLTASAVERFQFERNRIEREKQFNVASIQADEHLNDAQKQKLIVLEGQIATAKTQLTHQQEAEMLSRQELDRARARSDSEVEILDAQAGLARTAKERREIELKILKAQFAQLRAAQQAVIDSQDPNVTEADKGEARARLGDLGRLEGLATTRAKRDTQGPIENMLDSIPRTAEEADEAFQNIAAGGIASVIDGLSEAASGTQKLGDVFKNVAADIMKQLFRIAIQQAILGPLTKALFPGAPAVPIAGARAEGGSVVGGRNYFVGEKGIELFTPSTSGRIVANDDLVGGSRGTTIHQSINFSGAVDLATRAEVYRVADAARQSAIQGVREGDRRRG